MLMHYYYKKIEDRESFDINFVLSRVDTLHYFSFYFIDFS